MLLHKVSVIKKQNTIVSNEQNLLITVIQQSLELYELEMLQ